VVTFTSCPNGCTLTYNGLTQAVHIDPTPVTATIQAADSLPFPPQTQPVLPDFSSQCNSSPSDCSPTVWDQNQSANACANDAWVVPAPDPSIEPTDFPLGEGVVKQARVVAEGDSAEEGFPKEVDLVVQVDPPFRYLNSDPSEFGDPSLLRVEWNTADLPDT